MNILYKLECKKYIICGSYEQPKLKNDFHKQYQHVLQAVLGKERGGGICFIII